MNRVEALNRRYAAAESLVQSGIEIVVVGDPAGARLNAAARRLLTVSREDGPGLWDDLVGAVKLLRWHLVTQPQPLDRNPALRDGTHEVQRQIARLRGAVADIALVDELIAAVDQVSAADPLVGPVLRRSLEEVGAADCVVVAANRSAQVALTSWLGEFGAEVVTTGDLERGNSSAEQAYAVGPPRFFRSSLVTAPVVGALSFLVPAWFGDRSIPRSAIAPYADGAIQIEARTFIEGDISEPEPSVTATEDEDGLLPQPVWGDWDSPAREPNSEEVLARKVLLSGNLAIWLDDGERIRTLDPDQPTGERVTYTDVTSVRPGTYLLLRHGETERGALYQAALGLLAGASAAVDASQRAWKEQLAQRIRQHGYGAVVRDLRVQGVKAADRARAWTQASLVRPNSDRDFETLLQWLGMPVQPSFGHATMLRRALYRASADVREQLEMAVAAADLSALERDGYLSLDIKNEGFRGIIATRVIALSPNPAIVSHHDARVPFEDRSGQWLE